MNQLIAYLMDNLILDFKGELDLEMARNFLREDDSADARTLMAKLVQDRGVDDMIIVLADCLREFIRSGINEEVVRSQIRMYTEA